MTKENSHIQESQKSKRQVVAGFIIFQKTPDGTKFLFLYRRGGYWNFPKGHFEQGEDSLATALRETEEETGLKAADLRIVPRFKTYVRFHFFHDGHKIQDTVILYLAESRETRITISPREHSGYAWFLYKDAVKMLGRYMGTKRALKAAYDFLHPKAANGHPRHKPNHTSHQANHYKPTHPTRHEHKKENPKH